MHDRNFVRWNAVLLQNQAARVVADGNDVIGRLHAELLDLEDIGVDLLPLRSNSRAWT